MPGVRQALSYPVFKQGSSMRILGTNKGGNAYGTLIQQII